MERNKLIPNSNLSPPPPLGILAYCFAWWPRCSAGRTWLSESSPRGLADVSWTTGGMVLDRNSPDHLSVGYLSTSACTLDSIAGRKMKEKKKKRKDENERFFFISKCIANYRSVASKLRRGGGGRGVTFGRKWTIIWNRACNACAMSKSHCKTSMNRNHKLSNFIQTISNTAHLIYVCQCDKSSVKAKLYAPNSLYWVEHKRPQTPLDYHFITVGVYHG